MQGFRDRTPCDAVYVYMAALAKSAAVRRLQFEPLQATAVLASFSRLFGTSCTTLWCTQRHDALRRSDASSSTEDATVRVPTSVQCGECGPHWASVRDTALCDRAGLRGSCGLGVNWRWVQGFGRPLHVKGLHAFAKHLASSAIAKLPQTDPASADLALSMLDSLSSLGVPYQKVRVSAMPAPDTACACVPRVSQAHANS